MKKSLMNKSTLKILSLLIAILIWVVVKNVQDPMLVRIITRIPVTIVNESYLASNLEIPLLIDGQDTVNVKVKGREARRLSGSSRYDPDCFHGHYTTYGSCEGDL